MSKDAPPSIIELPNKTRGCRQTFIAGVSRTAGLLPDSTMAQWRVATALRVSAILQLALALYVQAIQWFRFGAWNDQPRFEPFWEQARAGTLRMFDVMLVMTFLLPFLAYLVAWRRQSVWLIWCCLVGYLGWLFLQLKTWWISYLFGASENWRMVYQRTFARTTKMLPSFGNHLAPDAMHLVLQLLLLAIVVSTLVGLLQPNRRHTANP